MEKRIIVNRIPGEQRIAVIEDQKLVDFSIIRDSSKGCLGNIYCGKVKRVMNGMQSAFVEFGGERTGFIHIKELADDISWEDYSKSQNEDEEEETPPSHKHKNIKDYIKDGDKILVQIIKEPIGEKGARLSSHITINGRFSVLMPTIKHIGISKKISDKETRKRLKELGEKVSKKGFGIILRTEAGNTESKIVEKEIVSMIKEWNHIKSVFEKAKNPVLIKEADSPLIETVKNAKTEELSEIVVDSTEDRDVLKKYLKNFIPEKEEILKLYEMPYSIFEYYSVESDIEKSIKKKIWMKNGGFLYIEQTEALTVIDVNTGKFVGKDSLEKTVVKTNLEAVFEIAYHIRLRNIAGIIIVDFIDMKNASNRKKVLNAFEEELKKDPSKTSLYYFTKLGLMQITRKRTKESNMVKLTEKCPYCDGAGIIKSRETVAFDIIREIQKQAKLYNKRHLQIEAHTDVIFILQYRLDKEIAKMTKDLKLTLDFKGNTNIHHEHFIVSDSF